jgi:hypothetical protein
MGEAEKGELRAAVRALKDINADYILGGNYTGLRFQLEVKENLPSGLWWGVSILNVA